MLTEKQLEMFGDRGAAVFSQQSRTSLRTLRGE